MINIKFRPTENFRDIFNSSKKVLVIGNYGDGNLGDEAILDVIISQLYAIRIKNITVVSRNPKKLKKLHNNNIKCISPPDLIKNFFCYDTIVIGGGTIFTDHPSLLIYILTLASLFWSIFRKKVIFLNIGYSNSTPRILKFMTIMPINLAKYVSVRDRKSLENLRKLGIKKPIELSHDLTFKLASTMRYDGYKSIISLLYKKENIDKNKLKIGIALRYSKDKKVNINVKKSIAKLIDHITSKIDAEVLFLTFCPGFVSSPSDKQFGLEIKKMIKHKDRFKILNYYSYPIILALIKDLDLLIGMRFHSLIFAYMAGTPFIGISNEEKCKIFLEEVGEKYLNPLTLSFEDLEKEAIKKIYSQK